MRDFLSEIAFGDQYYQHFTSEMDPHLGFPATLSYVIAKLICPVSFDRLSLTFPTWVNIPAHSHVHDEGMQKAPLGRCCLAPVSTLDTKTVVDYL